MLVKDTDHIAVWFSCGAASAVAAKITIEMYGAHRVRILNNPVIEEDADNRRFLSDVANWVGAPIELVSNVDYPSNSARDVWERRQFMSGPLGAPCTIELKKRARQDWERINFVDWNVLGFTVEEENRHRRFTLTERANVLPILIDKKLTKSDCYAILKDANIRPPRVYELGYPNANCIGCVKATSPTYWNLVRQQHPEVFADRANQSRQLGAKLVRVRNRRIFLDELLPSDKGRALKLMDFECGIFCEEKT